jgi:hypothetical protein
MGSCLFGLLFPFLFVNRLQCLAVLFYSNSADRIAASQASRIHPEYARKKPHRPFVFRTLSRRKAFVPKYLNQVISLPDMLCPCFASKEA